MRRIVPALIAACLAWAVPGEAAAGDESACRAHLAARGVQAQPLPAIEQGECGVATPLRLSRLRGLTVRRPATITCGLADALDRWATEVVLPAAKRELGRVPDALLVGTSYQCRTENRVAGAKQSEHAFANAVDLHGFAFAGRPDLFVGGSRAEGDGAEGGGEERFLAAVRRSACAYFTTVLGPGSDAAHADHLHLDMRRRDRGYRICQ